MENFNAGSKSQIKNQAIFNLYTTVKDIEWLEDTVIKAEDIDGNEVSIDMTSKKTS